MAITAKPNTSVSEPPPPDNKQIDSSFFDEEVENNISKKQWEDFLALQNSERQQPQQHEELKTVCMKVFPKLAQRTNLTPEELQTYYTVRFQYIQPYQDQIPSHENSLQLLAVSLLRAGKIQYELNTDLEESK